MEKIISILLALALVGGCGYSPQQAEYRRVSAAEAYEMMLNYDVLVLDVRTQAEFDGGHVPDAVLLPYSEVERVDNLVDDVNRIILVYCQSGRRSEIAARALVGMGFRNVYDFGGINEWVGEVVRFDFTITQRIQNDMPEFKFNIRGVNVPEGFETFDLVNSKIVSITITDNNGNLIQEITDLHTAIPANRIHDDMHGFSFDDWNFDGFMDMSLWRSPGGSMRNNPTYYWLWDNEIGQFVRNEELENMSQWSTPRVDEELLLIACFTRSGWDWNATAYFEYQDGNFVTVKSVERNVGRPDEHNRYDIHTIISELIDGEWVVTDEYVVDWEGEIMR